MVMEAVLEDSGDGSTLCTVHPYTAPSTPPGGICPLCLQDKLGILVSSSFPSSIFPSTSSSPEDSTLLVTKQPQGPKPSFSNYEKEGIIFQRSKSTAPSLRMGFGNDDFSPRRRGFWSFLSISKGLSTGTSSRQRSVRGENGGGACEDGRRVGRSRSIGCGSRSFSGDLFERISTFGDCTLRRVESQREGKVKNTLVHGGDRVKCGGIFGGFAHAQACTAARAAAHGRNKSWGWTFQSPMRAFGKRESGSSKKDANATPNLRAIPSLLAMGGSRPIGTRSNVIVVRMNEQRD